MSLHALHWNIKLLQMGAEKSAVPKERLHDSEGTGSTNWKPQLKQQWQSHVLSALAIRFMGNLRNMTATQSLRNKIRIFIYLLSWWFLLLLIIVFWDRILLCSPGLPELTMNFRLVRPTQPPECRTTVHLDLTSFFTCFPPPRVVSSAYVISLW